MADKRANVDWNDRKAVWSRVPSPKSAVTRACTAIDKLVDRKFIYDTPAACSDTRKGLIEAYDFFVELHDHWGDLKTEAGTEKASETEEESLRPYEDKQHVALSKLTEYVAKNSSVAPTPSTLQQLQLKPPRTSTPASCSSQISSQKPIPQVSSGCG